MYYTPGWGALLTLIATLIGGVGGVVLTLWGQRWLYRRQLADQHRLEKRESIASVLDASAALVGHRLHHCQAAATSLVPCRSRGGV
jgi:membrane protein YqaA with SNARE-associated domain